MADAPERARHTVGRLGTIITCAAVWALLAPPRLLGLPNQPELRAGLQATVPLVASETRKFQLGRGEHKNFLYEAVAQAAISISFVQTEEMLSVKWSSGGTLQVPRTNDAGLRSAIRFFLVPVAKTQETFDISCLDTRLSCAGTVTVSEAHPTVPADANIAAHEQMLAEAEDIRRRGNETSWPVALEKFRTAAEFFQASGDGARRRAARNGEARLLLYRLSDYRAAHNAAVDSILVDTGEADLQGQGLAWKTLSSVEAAVWTGLGDLYTQLNDDTRAEESYQKALPLCLPMSNAWRERMPPFCCRVKPEPPRN